MNALSITAAVPWVSAGRSLEHWLWRGHSSEHGGRPGHGGMATEGRIESRPMTDDDILDAIKKLRADLITALARIENEITTLEYCSSG